MKIANYKYILGAALALFSACGEDVEPVYTVGEADNAIVLQAGVVDGMSDLQTRAKTRAGETYVAFEVGNKMTLRIDGTWLEHKNENGEELTEISQKTTATTGTVNVDKNPITMNPQLYWDDYGTADPKNMSKMENGVETHPRNGRDKGLTIYGVAINDKNADAPDPTKITGNSWTYFPWELESDQKAGWSKKDLLISNNVKSDNTYKFDEKSAGKLLIYTHTMSKVTINLKANKGFPQSGENLIGNTTAKFEHNPEVVLTKFKENSNETGDDYPIINGYVNIETGEVTATPAVGNYAPITTMIEEIPASGEVTVKMSALVYPGTQFGPSDNSIIAKLKVDGNLYYIDASKIRAKMLSLDSSTDYKTKPGHNYVLNITVDKTEVHIDATIAEWIDVEAEPAEPKIDFNKNYGSTGTTFTEDFSFYYSKNKDYKAGEREDYYGIITEDLYAPDRTYTYSSNPPAFENPLYWPNHSTKYYFRGVWPETTTDTDEVLSATTDKGSTDRKPSVSVFEDTDNKQHQGIYVRNMTYNEGYFPSDLMLAIPTVKPEDETNDRLNEPEEGIGATEGKISMNFTYRMAQVEVRSRSSGAGEPDNIDFGSDGGADIAQVAIVGGKTEGYVILADGSIKFANDNTPEYVMTPKSSVLTSVSIPEATEYAQTGFWSSHPTLVRHDAIIPQSLGTDASPLKFVITTGSEDMTYDTYAIAIKDITLSSINEVACTEANNKITEWEAGKHYTYTLKITKTKVSIEATIQDWIPVVAGGDFWL